MEGGGGNHNLNRNIEFEEDYYYDEDDNLPRLIDDEEESVIDFLKREIAEMDQNKSGRHLNKEGSGSGSTSNQNTERLGINNTTTPDRASDLLLAVSFNAEPMRTNIIELAGSAMDELAKLAVSSGSTTFWKPLRQNRPNETLDDVKYITDFGNIDKTLNEIINMAAAPKKPKSSPFFDSRPIELALNIKPTPPDAYETESSRDFAYVRMQPVDIAQWLMDAEKYSDVFYNMVSKATNLGVLVDGVEGSLDGRLQVMSAEFHIPSTLMPTRECYFVRYSKKLSDTTWAIADVSLEKYFPHPAINYKRRPSGCFIQFMPHQNFSKVTWVEHGEADNRDVHVAFKDVIKSGFAYGASRWVSAIVRKYEYSETLKAKFHPPEDSLKMITEVGRMGMVKLGDRMMKTFCNEVTGAIRNDWFKLPTCLDFDTEDVRVAIREHPGYYEGDEDHGQPAATTLVFSSSKWFPIAPRLLFDFLCDVEGRSEWDVLSRGLCVHELSYVVKGKDPANRVSLLEVSVELQDEEDDYVINYLQETYTDIGGSYVVFAPMDEPAVTALLGGTDPEKIGILGSGFAIVPDNVPFDNGPHSGVSSILTASFHIIDEDATRFNIPPPSRVVIQRILQGTFDAVKSFVFSDVP